MQPIALTTKRTRNKYARERDGELMLVHMCTGCASIVINRIAADDSSAAILEVFDSSASAGEPALPGLASSDAAILTWSDRDLVRKRLFGDSHVRVQHLALVWVE